MTDPVQLVLVGLGRMGSVHANALAALDEIDVVAVADPSGDATGPGCRAVPERPPARRSRRRLQLSGRRGLPAGHADAAAPAAGPRRDRRRSSRAVREAAVARSRRVARISTNWPRAPGASCSSASGVAMRRRGEWRKRRSIVEISVHRCTCGCRNGMRIRHRRRSVIRLSAVVWRSTAACTSTTWPNGSAAAAWYECGPTPRRSSTNHWPPSATSTTWSPCSSSTAVRSLRSTCHATVATATTFAPRSSARTVRC